MINNIKHKYKEYILPTLITFIFSFYNKYPVLAASITSQKVGQKGGAQYNKLMIIDKTLLGISTAVLLFAGSVVIIILAGSAGRRMSASDFKGFHNDMNNILKLFINTVYIAATTAIITGILLIKFFATPK